MDEISLKRKEIDEIDRELIQLLGRRFKVVDGIGALKRLKKAPALDQQRWEEVLQKVRILGVAQGLDSLFVESVYELIHRYALSREE